MLRVRVHDEFQRLRVAIVHDGRNAVDLTMDDWRELLPPEVLANHPEAGPSSKKRLFQQHRRLRKLLADSGVRMLRPEAEDDACGQVFTRDPCFAIGETLYVGAPRDEWRFPEITGLRELRTRFARVVDLSGDDAVIEGGDVMVLESGRLVLVGMNRHTNESGFRKLSDNLAESGITIILVPHEALHLDCCLAPLPNGEALYSPRKLPEPSLSKLASYFSRLVELDADEADRYLAANMVWLDHRRAVSGVETTKTNALLRGKGYEVIELDFSDLISQWGSFRCAVCPIEREA